MSETHKPKGPVERPVRPPAEWLVRALVALARRKLADANANRESENAWPAGQSWNDLAGSSQNIFMAQAREEAGIPHDEYRTMIEAVMDGPEGEVLDRIWDQL